MRPQLAMAALFCLVIGSSLLLLRARPGTLGPVRVTENGAPAPAIEAAPDLPRGAAQAAATAAPSAAPVEVAAAPAATSDYGAPVEGRAKRDVAADREAEGAASSGADARAALAEAIALRNASGCAAAVSKLDAVAVRFAGTQAASDAMWEQATCYKQMGDRAKAQQLFLALRSTGYRDRAQAELGEDANTNLGQNQVANRAPVGVPPSAAPAAPRAAALADADQKQASEPAAAGAPAGAKAAKRPAAAPAAPNSKARPAPARNNAAFAP